MPVPTITYEALGDAPQANMHTRLSATVGKCLAESLPERHPLRLTCERRGELRFNV